MKTTQRNHFHEQCLTKGNFYSKALPKISFFLSGYIIVTKTTGLEQKALAEIISGRYLNFFPSCGKPCRAFVHRFKLENADRTITDRLIYLVSE